MSNSVSKMIAFELGEWVLAVGKIMAPRYLLKCEEFKHYRGKNKQHKQTIKYDVIEIIEK